MTSRLTGLDQLIKNEQHVNMLKPKAKSAQKTRIQNQNEQIILDAALEVFSVSGYRGATVDQIAKKAGLSKPNLLYYFRRKEDIYVAVLEHTLVEWLLPLRSLDVDGDPIEELTRYIEAKLDMSFKKPMASKLFANEVLHGAPHIEKYFKGPLRALVDEKAKTINIWMNEGKLAKTDPYHLIFAIWAVTQHYADFSVQVDALLGAPKTFGKTKLAILDILLRGLKLV